MSYNGAMSESKSKIQTKNTSALHDLWQQCAQDDITPYSDDQHSWDAHEEAASQAMGHLPHEWNPASPHRPVNQYMKDSIEKARSLLLDRRQMIEKSNRYISNASFAAFGIGAALISFSPIISTSLLAGSTVAHYINRKMTGRARHKFDTAENALSICDDYERSLPEREKAITDLRHTAEHLYYWEKTSKVSSTVVKFALGEIIPFVGALMSMQEVKDEMTKKRRKSYAPRTSFVLQDTIDIMQENLPYNSTPPFKM